MKRILLTLQFAIIAILFAGAPLQAVAQSDMDIQPGVVVALANVDEHLSDIEHLMEAAGVGQMSGLVRMGAAEYIRGIDADKPMGALLFFDEDNPEEPTVMAFVPVTDIEDVLDTLAPFVDIDEDGDDIILTANDGTEITTRVVDGYAFMVQDREMLENLPENPTNLLQDLPNQYNIAARVFGQNIPESLRQQAIDLIRSGAEGEMESLGDGPEADLQRANFEYTMDQMESFINETEEVVAGLAIDEDGNRIYIDFKMIGLEGSKLARQSNEYGKAAKSKFRGFLMENATATIHATGKLLDDDVQHIQKMIDDIEEVAKAEVENEGLSDDEAEAANRVISDLINVLRGSLEKGTMDFGGALNLQDDKVQLAVGMQIAEGAKLESSVKELAKWAEAEEDVPLSFNFDVANENGVRYHEITVAIPESEEEMTDLFGSSVDVLLGVGDDVLYAAAGHNPKEFLNECMSGSAPSGEEELIGQFNLHLLPFIKFLSRVQDAPELDDIADILPDNADDRMRMTVRAVPNGQHFRFEMEDAILKVLTEIGQSMGGGFGPPQDF